MATEKLIQPLPWSAESDLQFGGRLVDSNGMTITSQVTFDEAEFIADACNNHDRLTRERDALREALKGLRAGYGEGDDDVCFDYCFSSGLTHSPACLAARAALQLVEEGQEP